MHACVLACLLVCTNIHPLRFTQFCFSFFQSLLFACVIFLMHIITVVLYSNNFSFFPIRLFFTFPRFLLLLLLHHFHLLQANCLYLFLFFFFEIATWYIFIFIFIYLYVYLYIYI